MTQSNKCDIQWTADTTTPTAAMDMMTGREQRGNIRKHTVMYCSILYSTTLFCIVLYCTSLYSTVLHCSILYCTVAYCTVTATIHDVIIKLFASDFLHKKNNAYNKQTWQHCLSWWQAKSTFFLLKQICFWLFLRKGPKFTLLFSCILMHQGFYSPVIFAQFLAKIKSNCNLGFLFTDHFFEVSRTTY